jgi:uncharacterized protein YjbI with pentapeptide repeats
MKRKIFELFEEIYRIRKLRNNYLEIRFREYYSTREKNYQFRKHLLFIFLLIILFGLFVILINFGYSIQSTGFPDSYSPNGVFTRGKTLWDWLELLIVPIILTILAIYISNFQKNREISIEMLETQNRAIQDYHLLVTQTIMESKGNITLDVSKNLLRARTLAILSIISNQQKAALIQFIIESGLLNITSKCLDQRRFNLSNIEWLPGRYENIVLSGINMSKSHSCQSSFHQSIISGSNLIGSIIEFTSFIKADLNYCDLSHSEILSSLFTEARLIKAKLIDANLQGNDFRGSILRNAKLRGSNLKGSKFNKAYLLSADLSFTNLTDVDLSDANLSYANLYGAKLNGTILNNAILEGTIISKRQLLRVKTL